MDKNRGAILVCQIGGTLEKTAASKAGRQSRSLIAAYELTKAGFKNLQVLDGGMNGWAKADLPMYEITE